MNKKFDDLLRQKFESEKFEFREEYWADAAAQIKARKAAALWKWVSFSLSVVVVALTIWLSVTTNPTNQTAQQSEFDQRSDLNQSSSNQSSKSTANASNGDVDLPENTPTDINHNNASQTKIESGQASSPGGEMEPKQGKIAHGKGGKTVDSKDAGKASSRTDKVADGGKESGGSKPAVTTDGDKSSNPGPKENLPRENSPAKTDGGNQNLFNWDIKSRHFIVFSPLWIFDHPSSLVQAKSLLKPRVIPPIQNKKKISIALDLASSAQFNNSSVQEGDPYITAPDSFGIAIPFSEYQTKATLYNEFGIRLQRKNWGLRTGLGIGTIKENYKFEGTILGYSYDTTLNLVNTSFGPDGDHWLIEKQIDSTADRTIPNPALESTVTSKIHYLDLPINLYFEYPVNSKWTVMVGGGINFRLPFATDYYGLSEDGESIIKVDKSEFSGITNYNLFGQVNYLIAPNLDLVIKANGFTAGKALNPNNGIKYRSSNLGVGVTYWIKR